MSAASTQRSRSPEDSFRCRSSRWSVPEAEHPICSSRERQEANGSDPWIGAHDIPPLGPCGLLPGNEGPSDVVSPRVAGPLGTALVVRAPPPVAQRRHVVAVLVDVLLV